MAENVRSAVDDLDWSDEENDHLKYIPQHHARPRRDQVDLEEFNETNRILTQKSNRIIDPESKLLDHDRSLFKGYVIPDNPDKLAALSRLLPDNHNYTQFNNNDQEFISSTPTIPPHLIRKLGKKFIDVFWQQCVLAEAVDIDAEMVLRGALTEVSKKIEQSLGYSVPFDKIHMKGIDDDDFVHFLFLVEQLANIRDDYEAIGNGPHGVAMACCAFRSCKHFPSHSSASSLSSSALANDGGVDNVSARDVVVTSLVLPEEVKRFDPEGEGWRDASEHFRARIIFDELILYYNGKLRVRHVFMLMEHLGIPYEKNRLPNDYWIVKGDLLVSHLEEFLLLIHSLRLTDSENKKSNNKSLAKEAGRNAKAGADASIHGERDAAKVEFKYPVPEWLTHEFSTPEIMLYELRFCMVDPSNTGALTVSQLHQLFAFLGSTVSLEETGVILQDYDIQKKGRIDFAGVLILLYRVHRGTLFSLEGSDLAQALLETKAQLKVFEEIEESKVHPPRYCRTLHFGGLPITCFFAIEGPPQSPYHMTTLHFQITFFDGYPYRVPDVKFSTRIIALNFMMRIDGEGRLLHLTDMWDSSWSICRLLAHVVHVLGHPRLALLPTKFAAIAEEWNRRIDRILEGRGWRPSPSFSRDRSESDLSAAHAEGKVIREDSERPGRTRTEAGSRGERRREDKSHGLSEEMWSTNDDSAASEDDVHNVYETTRDRESNACERGREGMGRGREIEEMSEGDRKEYFLVNRGGAKVAPGVGEVNWYEEELREQQQQQQQQRQQQQIQERSYSSSNGDMQYQCDSISSKSRERDRDRERRKSLEGEAEWGKDGKDHNYDQKESISAAEAAVLVPEYSEEERRWENPERVAYIATLGLRMHDICTDSEFNNNSSSTIRNNDNNSNNHISKIDAAIAKLPRIEQMHLNVIFLYLTNRPAYREKAREYAVRFHRGIADQQNQQQQQRLERREHKDS